MTMAITKAVEEGAKAVICASTGNTSASAAAYAARAGHHLRRARAAGQDRDGQARPGAGARRAAAAGRRQLRRLPRRWPASSRSTTRSAWSTPSTRTASRGRRPPRSRSSTPSATPPTSTACRSATPATSPPTGRATASTPHDGHRHATPAHVRLPGRRRRADRARARWSSSRRRSPPRSASATRRPGPRRSTPATTPAAASTPSPTGRSSRPTGCSPAARRSSSSRPRPRRVAGLLQVARGRRARAGPAGRLHGHRQRPQGPGVGDLRRAGAGQTIPVDAAPRPQRSLRPDERRAVRVRVGCRPPAPTSGRASTALGLALTCYDVVEFAVTAGRARGRGHRRRRRRRAHATSRTWSCGPSGPPAPSSAGRRRACASPRQRASRTGAGWAPRPPPSSPASLGAWALCPDVDGDRRRRRPAAGHASWRGTRTTSPPACSAARRFAWTSAEAGAARCGSSVAPERRARACFVPERDPVDATSRAGCCPSAVPHADAAANAARAALLVARPDQRPGAAARRHRGPAAPALPGARRCPSRSALIDRLRAAGHAAVSPAPGRACSCSARGRRTTTLPAVRSPAAHRRRGGPSLAAGGRSGRCAACWTSRPEVSSR